MKLFLVLILCSLIVACSSYEKKQSDTAEVIENINVYSGMFLYAADTGVIELCNSSERYLVDGDVAYLGLEKAYLKIKTSDYQKIYVQVKGQLVDLDNTKGLKQKLTINKLLSIDAIKKCK